jgi:uncharacterized protein (DUF885 family)
MKRILKWFGLLLLGLVLLSGALLAHTWYFKPLSINWFYTRVFLQFALDSPELLTQLRILEPVGIRSHNAKLADASIAHDDAIFARLKDDYATLKRYDASAYAGQDRISYDIFDYFVGTQVRGEPWRYHNYPVNQLFGVQSNLPNLMTQQQQVNDATDAENYIARLGEFPRKLKQVIESIKVRESKGVVPPKFVVEKVIDQIKGFLAPGAKGNTLTVSFKEKLDKIPADKMNDATRSALLARVEQAVSARVFPAYNTLAAYFETLRPKALRNDGVWALPDGDKFYQYEVESNTTTKMTAEQVHQIGLAEVARIGAEMDRILKDAGYSEGTVAERVRKLAKSPDQLYPDSDAGRAQILKDYQAIIDEVTAGLDPWFGIRPASKVEVKRVPPFTEKTAPAAYYNPPPMDKSRPGIFFANLGDVSATAKFNMHTFAYHEAVPGHHLQIAIAQEVKGLPIFRSVIPFTAYAEGWGLYAEQLEWEMGYEKNPLDNLGRLQAEMFRAVRLVVDTGMHSKRWTREQAIDYMMANTGMPEGDVVIEIERYLVNPGQALAYKVGMMKILELRERAKTALGGKFDIREFHDEVLKNGGMPLGVLERVIDAYVARKKAV